MSDRSSEAYRYVIGFGLICSAACLLHHSGFRSFALPFDWVALTPAVIEYCLRDDFADYLARLNYEPLDQPDRWRNRVFAERHGLGIFPNHHDTSQPGDYRYLEWAVERLRTILASDSRKMFEITRKTFDHSHFPSLFDETHARTRNAKIVAITTTSFDAAPADRRLATISLSDRSTPTRCGRAPTGRTGCDS